MTVDVSVVIVAYEGRELLGRCLAALDADAATARATRELIVVDQASSDGTAAWLRAERPDVRLLALPRNVGFGAGNNRGIDVAEGRWLLLLNTDCFVDRGAVDELVRFGEAGRRIGAVGPRLRWPDGSLQRSCRSFPTVWRIGTEYLYLRKLAPRSTTLNDFYCGGFDHDRARRVDWLTGAALLVRREALERCGAFDERFFMYSEEVDLLRRFADAGWETWFDPAAGAVHVWGGTTRQEPGRTYREQLRSHVRYLDLHEGRRSARVGRDVLLAGLALRGVRSAAFRDAARWLAQRPVPELLAEESAPRGSRPAMSRGRRE
jgi:N-acetylglucosaminyl-diphospho-decaprenol L-rhamnosyltransferase